MKTSIAATMQKNILLPAAAIVSALFQVACGCGIGPVPDANSDGGSVAFNSVAVGQSELLQVPVKDSADTSERLMSERMPPPSP
jgi:hypothetical protein